MNIITKEHLAATLIQEVLEKFNTESLPYKNSDETLDEYAYRNLADLGLILYDVIGDKYGDLDDALFETAN
jgi:hypothetical protein